MQDTTKYVGLDVSKEKISVAVADAGRQEPRYLGTIPHTPEAIRRLIKQLGDKSSLEVCYEAGPTGYELYRWFQSMGVNCTVIAPSLIPKRPGEHIKTDRRDAVRLAQLFRAGELVTIHVPTRDDEALRDLVRAREDAKIDLHRARQRLIKFLLRHQVHPPASITRRWTKAYRLWLERLTLERRPEQIVFDEYLHAIFECENRLKRVESALVEQASTGPYASLVYALQALRGIAIITAVTVAAEIGDFKRFRHPFQLMAYLGLVPREYSSGGTTRRGGMTKAGNSHARRVIVEASWSYRHRPAVKGKLRERLKDQSLEIQAISWKAQTRLHDKYKRLAIARGKHKNIAIGAVARELVGFIWAIAHEIENNIGA